MSAHPREIGVVDGPPVDGRGSVLELAMTEAEVELAALRLKVRLYENGTHVNQPLVDDIERFRQSAIQAMRQRDRTQGINNKLRKRLAERIGA